MLSLNSKDFKSSTQVSIDGKEFTLHALSSADIDFLQKIEKIRQNTNKHLEVSFALIRQKIEPRAEFESWYKQVKETNPIGVEGVLIALQKALNEMAQPLVNPDDGKGLENVLPDESNSVPDTFDVDSWLDTLQDA